MFVRGIRGATSVTENTPEAIRIATRELLRTIVQENELDLSMLVSAIFTVTKDLNADFPASTARELGWNSVPLICATEIDVPGAMPLVIRVLIHTNTTKSQTEIKHVYLGAAAGLRRDLAAQ